MQSKLIAILLLSASLIPGQSNRHRHSVNAVKRHSSKPTRARASTEYLRLINRLRSAGATVKLTDERVRQPFFSVSGKIFSINEEGVQVFEYASASAAEDQAKRVTPDGMTIGTSKPSWMAPPHFFMSGKSILLYVGTTESILKVLQASFGRQFAGS
jgi:hypothetical protein